MTQKELVATATLEDLVAFLSQDEEADLTQYGKDGWGSLERFLEEVRAGDVTLHYNPKTRLIEAVRLRTRGILRVEGYRLREVKRKRPKEKRLFGIFKQWKTLEKRCEYAISETILRRVEEPRAALSRGIWEEWGRGIQKDLLEPVPMKDSRDDENWSTAYPRIWSVGFSYWFYIRLSKRPWIWNPVIWDTGILIYLEWFWEGPGKEEWYPKLQRQILTLVIRTYVSVRYLF